MANRGIRTPNIPKPMNRLSQNLARVIMLAVSRCMPEFNATALVGRPSTQIGEILLSHVFSLFC